MPYRVNILEGWVCYYRCGSQNHRIRGLLEIITKFFTKHFFSYNIRQSQYLNVPYTLLMTGNLPLHEAINFIVVKFILTCDKTL